MRLSGRLNGNTADSSGPNFSSRSSRLAYLVVQKQIFGSCCWSAHFHESQFGRTDQAWTVLSHSATQTKCFDQQFSPFSPFWQLNLSSPPSRPWWIPESDFATHPPTHQYKNQRISIKFLKSSKQLLLPCVPLCLLQYRAGGVYLPTSKTDFLPFSSFEDN